MDISHSGKISQTYLTSAAPLAVKDIQSYYDMKNYEYPSHVSDMHFITQRLQLLILEAYGYHSLLHLHLKMLGFGNANIFEKSEF